MKKTKVIPDFKSTLNEIDCMIGLCTEYRGSAEFERGGLDLANAIRDDVFRYILKYGKDTKALKDEKFVKKVGKAVVKSLAKEISLHNKKEIFNSYKASYLSNLLEE